MEDVDGRMLGIVKHPQAKLWPSELVTVGVLAALKGEHFRAFYRWLKRDYDVLFGGLPNRTRLQRALTVHQNWCERLLAELSFFTVIDSYPIELISRSAKFTRALTGLMVHENELRYLSAATRTAS